MRIVDPVVDVGAAVFEDVVPEEWSRPSLQDSGPQFDLSADYSLYISRICDDLAQRIDDARVPIVGHATDIGSPHNVGRDHEALVLPGPRAWEQHIGHEAGIILTCAI